MQSQKRQNDLSSFPRQTIQYHGNPKSMPQPVKLEEAEVERFYEDLQDLLELTPKRDALFSIGVAAAAKLLQPCLTLCDPIDGSPPGSPIPGILQARTLEWVAISFSSA